MRGHLCIFVAGVLLTCRVGGLAAEGANWSAQVEVLMVAVKPVTSITLLPKLREERSTHAAFGEVMRLIENGEADLLGWPSVMVRNETRAVSETVEEVRYPTEFDPPSTPGSSFTRGAAPETCDWRSMHWDWGRGEITPTAFETRNIGQKLEVEASTEEESGQIRLYLAAEDLRFVKYHEFAGVEALNGGKGELVQPEFASSKFTGMITARKDAWMLLSSFVEQKPKPRVILFLLRVISLPGAAQKPTQ